MEEKRKNKGEVNAAERGVFKVMAGERSRGRLVYESRVRADATAVLMPRNSSRLFTLINKGKLGKRTGISGKSSAFVLRPFVHCKRAGDEIAIGFNVL